MKSAYKRYGCKMGCGMFKCKHDTPVDPAARKQMKHINKIRQLRAISKDVSEELDPRPWRTE